MKRLSTEPSLCRRCRRRPKRGSTVSQAISSFLAPRASAATVLASSFSRIDSPFRKRPGSGSTVPPGVLWHSYRAQIAPEMAKNKGVRASWQPPSASVDLIVQSIAFGYASGGEPHREMARLNLSDPERAITIKGAADMEDQVLSTKGLDGLILRYGFFYGPGTWHERPTRKPGLHIDAAAQGACLALTRGARGIYNIADDDGVVAIAKARAELGFDPQFRLR